MPQYFHRLENALKRANEFIDVGKKPEALDILCDVLRSRKHRTWQKYHGEIMVKYLELCVELRKSYIAKEGIYQYKIICQQTQIKSFEDVVRKYLELAESKAEMAKEAAQAATVDVDDLDNLATPENILLSAVSSEVSQDRTDRVLLLPWVKFLWESYRQCLDLLKNNARTEKLYHEIGRNAFQFCMKFNRKTEFRKLCDNLHTHLDILKKQQQQLVSPVSSHALQNIINLSNGESQALHLETRLQQLDCAITMELWQEAYKATDDIKRFNLMNLSKKPLKPQLMASYYHKLALVFHKANCPLFHAAALLRHFLLTKEWRKNIKEEDVCRMASKVVTATLSIPIPPTRPEIDKLVDTEENVVENHHRNLASLLGLSTLIPTRSSLVRDLKRMNILPHAPSDLQLLYHWLEQDFDPLLLSSRVQGVISFMDKSDDLKPYIQPVKEVAIVRLLKEISQIYSTIQLKRILQLCPFADSITLEHFVVSAARRNDLQVRIDHRRACLHFGNGLVSGAEEVVEGPHIQSMASSQIRSQLVNMFSALQHARGLIEPEKMKNQREKLKGRIMTEYERNKHVQHKNLLDRSKYIEARREEIAAMRAEVLLLEERQAEEAQARLRREEEARMKKETEERARQRQMQEEEELKRRMAKDTIENMRLTEAGQKILETFGEDELADLKVEDIKSKQWEQLEKERKEQIARQQKLEKKIDHLERAKRLEEIPLLEEMKEKDAILNKDIFERMELQRIEELKTERALALQHRDRLLRMKTEAGAFASNIKSTRYAEYEIKVAEWRKKIEKARADRLEERRKKREEDRRREYYKAKKEEEDRRREEEKRAEMERLKREREEERAHLDELAAKQRQREEEVEAKRQAKEEESLRSRQDHPALVDRDPTRTRADEGPWQRGTGPSTDRPRILVAERTLPLTEPEVQKWRPKRAMEGGQPLDRQPLDRQPLDRQPLDRQHQEKNQDPQRSDREEKWQRGSERDDRRRDPPADARSEVDRPRRFIDRDPDDSPQDWRKGSGFPPDRDHPPRRDLTDRDHPPRRDLTDRDHPPRRDLTDREGRNEDPRAHGKRDFGSSDTRRDFGDDPRRDRFTRPHPGRFDDSRGGRFDDPRSGGRGGVGQERERGIGQERERGIGQERERGIGHERERGIGHDGPSRDDWSRGPRDTAPRDSVPPKPKKILDVPPHLRKQEPAPPRQQSAPKDGPGSDDGWTAVRKR